MWSRGPQYALLSTNPSPSDPEEPREASRVGGPRYFKNLIYSEHAQEKAESNDPYSDQMQRDRQKRFRSRQMTHNKPIGEGQEEQSKAFAKRFLSYQKERDEVMNERAKRMAEFQARIDQDMNSELRRPTQNENEVNSAPGDFSSEIKSSENRREPTNYSRDREFKRRFHFLFSYAFYKTIDIK